jgi:hypothetical protein
MQRKDEKDRKIICKYDPLEVIMIIILFNNLVPFLEFTRLRVGTKKGVFEL